MLYDFSIIPKSNPLRHLIVRHAIFVPYYGWGHLRTESELAVTFLRRYTDLVISFFCQVDFVKRAKDEMSRQCISEEERNSLLSRVRVIAYGDPQPVITPELAQILLSMDPREVHDPPLKTCADGVHMINKLMDGQTFIDKLGQEWGPVGAVPKILVADLVMGNIVLPVKEKYNIWVFVWWAGSIGSFTRAFAPLKHGGRTEGYSDECEAIFAEPERRNGRSFREIALDVRSPSTPRMMEGKVGVGWWDDIGASATKTVQIIAERDHRASDNFVRLAGMPPYFQWEDYPQPVWLIAVYNILIGGKKLVDAADGFLMTTLEELEPEGHKDMIQWARRHRVLCLGPQLPVALFSQDSQTSAEALAKLDVNYNAVPAASVANQNGNHMTTVGINGHVSVDPAIAFLDRSLAEYGQHSAIYVSFGSLLSPHEAHMKILIETLLALEKPMPFIITNASGSLSDDLKVATEKSGRGLVVAWAPQQAMLSHPISGLGWMITHCGGGGMFESLSSGMPVIAWPFMGDEPQHALWISQVLDTGFELLQVRTGVPGKPGLRNGTSIPILGTAEAIRTELHETLQRAQGKDGARKRENAQKFKNMISNAVKKG